MRPLGIYLALVPSIPQHQVDVWIRHLVQVVQSAGGFSRRCDEADDMPLNGYIKLDMYMKTLTQIYKKPGSLI